MEIDEIDKKRQLEEKIDRMTAERICHHRNRNTNIWLDGIKKRTLTNRAKFVKIPPEKMTAMQSIERSNILVNCLKEF